MSFSFKGEPSLLLPAAVETRKSVLLLLAREGSNEGLGDVENPEVDETNIEVKIREIIRVMIVVVVLKGNESRERSTWCFVPLIS